jgi:hypothetical protein
MGYPPKKSPSILLQARGILIPPSAKRAGGILKLFSLKQMFTPRKTFMATITYGI